MSGERGTLSGTGRAHGAVTVVNAIPAGRGAAMGLVWATEATVELTEAAGPVTVSIEDAPNEDAALGKACVAVVAEDVGRELSGHVATRSDVPIARGLKSSSMAANATVLAVLDALGEDPPDPERVLRLSLAAARRAGVTVTGALDDAAASLMGGLVLTDNHEDRIVHRKPIQKDHHVLLLVPRRKRYTREAAEALGSVRDVCQRQFERAEAGDWATALTLNGLAVAAALGEPMDPAYRALAAGALAAGMTGTGPAVAAVCEPDAVPHVNQAWRAYQNADILTTFLRTDAHEGVGA